jgi:glycosyltransferase involved in cell wall biosynthesis
MDVPVYELGPVRVSRPWTVLRARRALRRLLEKQVFDSVITHLSWPHAIFAAPVRRAGIPLANWIHGFSKGGNWLENWASLTKPDLAICNSRFTQREVHRLHKGAKSVLVYMPVLAPANIASRRSVRSKLGVGNDTVVILQASRMEDGKGHGLHLQALAKIRDVPGWVCWFAGGGQRPEERSYEEKLRQQATELEVEDRVHFLGMRADMSDVLSAADIFCQPNRSPDSFGIVFVEALLAGVPVVSTKMGGVSEIVDDSCGLLAPPNDSEALSLCLRKLVGSAEERLRLGHAGPKRAAVLCDPTARLKELHRVLRDLGPGSGSLVGPERRAI